MFCVGQPALQSAIDRVSKALEEPHWDGMIRPKVDPAFHATSMRIQRTQQIRRLCSVSCMVAASSEAQGKPTLRVAGPWYFLCCAVPGAVQAGRAARDHQCVRGHARAPVFHRGLRAQRRCAPALCDNPTLMRSPLMHDMLVRPSFIEVSVQRRCARTHRAKP